VKASLAIYSHIPFSIGLVNGLQDGGNYVPVEHQLAFNEVHSVILKKKELFITTSVRISDPTLASDV
jgi:hypothetical protein